jgi:hypothetical protein
VSGAPRPTHEEKQAVVRHGDGEAVSKIEEGAARLTGGRKKDYWAAVEIGCILKYRGGAKGRVSEWCGPVGVTSTLGRHGQRRGGQCTRGK